MSMPIELLVPDDDVPKGGYVATTRYAADDVCISTGNGCKHDDRRPVMIVELRRVHLRLIGGERMIAYIGAHAFADDWAAKAEAALEYFLKHMITPGILEKLCNVVADHHYEDGERRARASFKTWLHKIPNRPR